MTSVLVAMVVLMATLAATSNNPKSAYAAGQIAPAFQVRTTDGKPVNFPSDYKGKVVLLDFWATWCGPCREELPNVIAAYQKYHAKGLEVLGISLDREGDGAKLAAFTRDNHMPWPQIYDGKFWKADLAVKYGINSIPRPLLIDGNTGKVLVEGPAARGSHLAPAIERALAATGVK